MNKRVGRDEIWQALAELFFLDTEKDSQDFKYVAKMLKDASWSREETLRTLVELIAPVAGSNLGYLIYPMIGEWAGFDKRQLCQEINKRLARRKKYPQWCFYLQDKYCAWMLKELHVSRLLKQL